MHAIADGDVGGIASRLLNVLETVTAKEYPDIEGIKDKMRECGALNALMSGSGPTVLAYLMTRTRRANVTGYSGRIAG